MIYGSWDATSVPLQCGSGTLPLPQDPVHGEVGEMPSVPHSLRAGSWVPGSGVSQLPACVIQSCSAAGPAAS